MTVGESMFEMTVNGVGQRQKRQKIVPFDQLPAIRHRYHDRRIVQCHGAFDLVHLGHLVHFEEARTLGDVLVVTITADRFITKKRAVTFTEQHRAHQVAALEIVDYVVVVEERSALSAIEALRPDVYVKGAEHANLVLDKSRSVYHEMQLLERHGGRIHFTTGETFSSTKLSHFLLASPEVAQDNPLLRNDRVRFKDMSHVGFTLEQLKLFLARAGNLRVCVVGETIIDEWVDVSTANLSTQSRCIAAIETARVRQIGGAGIIALHLAGFVREVDCFTNDLSGDLPANVHVTQLSASQFVETRFVDRDTGHPLFKTERVTLGVVLHDRVPEFDAYDLVLIADFGHGLLDAVALNERIARTETAYVAVMAQANSSNYGYNLPAKYVGADYYSLNRTEAELSLHQRGLTLPDLVERCAALFNASAISVTDGGDGVMAKVGDECAALPSLSTTVVDTIGCGDAYFALSSAAACAELSAPLVTLVGSIASGAMSQRRCNESPVTEEEFLTIGKIVI